MATLRNYKTLKRGFSNEITQIEVTHDFAKDGGVVGTLDVLLSGNAMVIHNAVFKVLSAYDSDVDGMSNKATISFGVSGDEAGIMSPMAMADMVDGAAMGTQTFNSGYKLDAGSVVLMTIDVANLIQGKGKLVLTVSEF